MTSHDKELRAIIAERERARTWSFQVPINLRAQETDVFGVEVFCRSIGIDPLPFVQSRRHAGYQVEVNGFRIKVYSCDPAKKKARNLAPKQREETFEIYALCYVTPGERSWVHGWITGVEFERFRYPNRAHQRNGAWVDLWIVERPKLHRDIEELRRILGLAPRQSEMFPGLDPVVAEMTATDRIKARYDR